MQIRCYHSQGPPSQKEPKHFPPQGFFKRQKERIIPWGSGQQKEIPAAIASGLGIGWWQ